MGVASVFSMICDILHDWQMRVVVSGDEACILFVEWSGKCWTNALNLVCEGLQLSCTLHVFHI